VLLIVRSQYRYWVISKILQPSKVPTKIFILSCVHISFKINISLIQTTPPPTGRAPQFGRPVLGYHGTDRIWNVISTFTQWAVCHVDHCLRVSCWTESRQYLIHSILPQHHYKETQDVSNCFLFGAGWRCIVVTGNAGSPRIQMLV
jgi:hypothetical protein